MMKKKLLDKLKFPGMDQEKDEKSFEMEMSGSEEPPEMEAGEEEVLEADAKSMEASPFEAFSDDEILEEFKKRGLSLEAKKEPSSDESDPEFYS